jgi:hypothetical protein|tara:strand:- start:897 stop:1202 length:306 start_codon:yes stop_codon:yes gene_type:complete
MNIEFNDNELEEEQNPALKEKVEKDTELKNLIVSYVGKKKKPENDEVTLEMVLEVMAEDFPDFVMPIAEENWIRGYQQALSDVDEGQRLMKEAEENTEESE